MAIDLWPDSVRDASPVHLAQTEAIGVLRADPRMTAKVAGRIYTAIPPGTGFPMILVTNNGGSDDRARFRHASWGTSIVFRPSSQVRGDWEVVQIGDLIRMILERPENAPLPPFRSIKWEFETASSVYADDYAGIQTWHRPIVMRASILIA